MIQQTVSSFKLEIPKKTFKIYYKNIGISADSEVVWVIYSQQMMIDLLPTICKKRGIYVMPAYSTREALEKDMDVIPDQLIIDKVMPGMDGFELIDLLKSTSAITPMRIIMLTSCNKPSNIVEGLDAGADDYISKPFDPYV